MKIYMFMLLCLVMVSWCTTVQPLQFEEEPVAPIQTIEEEEPTVESEIPLTTDEEIVTQPDTSI